HEEADESIRVPRHRRSHRGLVSGHTGNQRRSCDTLCVEFLHPTIGKCLRCAGVVPLKLPTQRFGRVPSPSLSRERGEELRGEEMAVGVVQHDWCNSRCKMQDAKWNAK